MCDEYLSDYSDESNETDDGVSSDTYFSEFDDVDGQELSEDFELELEGEYDDYLTDLMESSTELDDMLAECEADDMAENEYYDAEKADELEAMMNELYEDSDDDSDDYMVKVKTR